MTDLVPTDFPRVTKKWFSFFLSRTVYNAFSDDCKLKELYIEYIALRGNIETTTLRTKHDMQGAIGQLHVADDAQLHDYNFMEHENGL